MLGKYIAAARHLIPSREALHCSASIDHAELPHLQAWMSRDWDRPTDFADATLVYLAKRGSLSVIITVDQADFATYRIEGKRQFRIVPSKRP